jgi:hypothetical protein
MHWRGTKLLHGGSKAMSSSRLSHEKAIVKPSLISSSSPLRPSSFDIAPLAVNGKKLFAGVFALSDPDVLLILDQLASSFESLRLTLQRCMTCHEPFLFLRKRRYCSLACRQMAYRQLHA